MRLGDMPEVATDWSLVAASTVPGASGAASVRARKAGEAQLRIVEYGAGYVADHWCSKGHGLYVIAGALAIEHEDGRAPCHLVAGMTWHVGDDEAPAHRVRSEQGARVFIYN